MPEINNKEYVWLTQEWADKKWVDKFTLDDTLLQEEFDKALQNTEHGLEKSDYAQLKAKIDWLVKQINQNNDDLLDASIMDGGKINVNDNQEIAALNVIKEKIIQDLNSKIGELLWSDMDLKYHMYDMLGSYNLLPPSIINEVELAVNKNDKPFIEQLAGITKDPTSGKWMGDVLAWHKKQISDIDKQLLN